MTAVFVRNTYVRAACVMPRSRLNRYQGVVVKVAVNSVALLYLIYTSQVLAQRVANIH